MTTLSGGQAARASLAAILLAPLRRVPARRADQRPRLRRARPARAFLDRRCPAARWWCRTTAPSSSARSPRCSSSTSTPTAPTEFGGGWAARTSTNAPRRARHAESGVRRRTATSAERSRTAAREQRQWAVQGARNLTKRPKDNDKAQRDFFLNRTEKQAGEGARHREGDRAPRRRSTSRGRAGSCGSTIAAAPRRRGRGPPRRRGRPARRLRARPDRPGDRLGRAGRDPRARTAAARRRCSRALLGRLPLDVRRRWLGPGVVVGEIDQARAQLSRATQSTLDAFVARERAARQQDARSLLAKFGLGADARRADRAALLSPGERTRAVLALLMARGVNCLVLDEPTNHLDLPAIEQLEQALDTFDGTLHPRHPRPAAARGGPHRPARSTSLRSLTGEQTHQRAPIRRI